MTSPERYEATWASLNQHETPTWFKDAKLGIFIHWGVYSVPAWAPPHQEGGEFYNEWNGHNHPYAELYGLEMRYKNSETWKYHRATYGADFDYDDFIPMFSAAQWDPAAWARLFKDIGARYLVLVTQHADDFAMWPTDTNPRNAGVMGPCRDIVGDLTTAIRAQGLKMGLYHGFTFNEWDQTYPHFPYVAKIHKQVKELIDRYSPDILWPDSYWKPKEQSSALQWRSKEVIAYFYNHAERPDEVLVNDRCGKEENDLLLGDISTPEYAVLPDITDFYWELTRGIGESYGYKQNDVYLSVTELVHVFVDVVSKNGSLLLNVGPKADGTLPEAQVERLRGLGAWLSINGDAIYGTRPWVMANGETTSGVPVRFTSKGETLYITFLDNPGREITLPQLRIREHSAARVLGSNGQVTVRQDDDGVHLTLPDELPGAHAFCLEMTPQPWALVQKTSRPSDERSAEMWRRLGYLQLGEPWR